MEDTMNKLYTHALQEPNLAAFVVKKIFHHVELSEVLDKLSEEDIDELIAILWGMGFKDNEIKKLLQ